MHVMSFYYTDKKFTELNRWLNNSAKNHDVIIISSWAVDWIQKDNSLQVSVLDIKY